jgi:hypothetical protein
VANKRVYLDRLPIAVQELHKCGAVGRESVPMHEVFREEFITILELPPVDSPQSAVKAGVAHQIKKARSERQT